MDQLLNHYNSIFPMPPALVEYLNSAAIFRTLKKRELLLSAEFRGHFPKTR